MSDQDLTSPSINVEEDPADVMFQWFRTMYECQPVYQDENDLWQVFGYAEVPRILSDPVTFSSGDTVAHPAESDIEPFRVTGCRVV